MAAANDSDRTGQTQVKLSKSERDKRGHDLAAEQLALEQLERKKSDHVEKWNAEIKTLRANISQLASEVDTGLAWVAKQQDLLGVNDDDDDAQFAEVG